MDLSIKGSHLYDVVCLILLWHTTDSFQLQLTTANKVEVPLFLTFTMVHSTAE